MSPYKSDHDTCLNSVTSVIPERGATVAKARKQANGFLVRFGAEEHPRGQLGPRGMLSNPLCAAVERINFQGSSRRHVASCRWQIQERRCRNNQLVQPLPSDLHKPNS